MKLATGSGLRPHSQYHVMNFYEGTTMSSNTVNTVHEMSFHVKRHANKWVNNYMTDAERRGLISISMSAYILYEYYLQKYDEKDLKKTFAAMEDDKAALVLGWTERRVADVRRALVKNNWLYDIRGRMNDGRKTHSIYLGQDIILEIKKEIPA